MNSISLVLPYPPPVNNLYRVAVMGKRAYPYKTDEHRKYMREVGALNCGWRILQGSLAVEAALFRPQRRGDIDGPIKALFDALNGRVWVDDSQVVDLRLTRHDDKNNPRVEVTVRQVGP